MLKTLFQHADIALRSYRVQSKAPFIGRLIEWLRCNLTSHIKEPYLDIIIEREVDYNRLLAVEIKQLQTEVRLLRRQLAKLQAASPANCGNE